MYVCTRPWAHIPHKPERKDQVWPWPLIFNPTHADVCVPSWPPLPITVQSAAFHKAKSGHLFPLWWQAGRSQQLLQFKELET